MTVSQSEQKNKQEIDETRRKNIVRITFAISLLSLIVGVLLPILRPANGVPNAFGFKALSAVIQLTGVFLMWRRRLNIGRILFLLSPPIMNFVVVSQTENIGLLFTIGILVMYLLIVPQMYAQTSQVIRIQVVAFIVAGLFILADMFWPTERIIVGETILNLTIITFVLLLLISSYFIYQQFTSLGLRGKLISTTLVVAVVAVVLVGVGVNSLTRRALTVEVGNNLNTLAQSQGLAVGELIAREINTLEVLALNRTLQTGATINNDRYSDNPAEIEAQLLAIDAEWQSGADNDALIRPFLTNPIAAELLEFRREFPENAEVFVTDRYGAVIAATNRTTDFYQADEEWWQTAYNGGEGSVFLGLPEYDESVGQTAMQIAVPLYAHSSTASNELVGVVRSTFTLSTLSDVVYSARFEETGKAELLFPNGVTLVALGNGEYMLEERQLEPAVLAELQNPTTLYLDSTYNEIPSLMALATVTTLTHENDINELGWRVLIYQANTESFSPILAQQQFNAVLGLIVIMMAGGTAAIVGQRLTAPIIRLTNAAEKIASGDLTVRATAEAQDEIGTLANTFNTMATQMQELIGSLEHRVAVRTRALEISGNVSRQISNILDKEALVTAVVELIKDSFDYYHTHIYLFDNQGKNLIMVGGTGEAGQQMLANNHQISAGRGLVGRAGQTGQSVLVPDTTHNETWLPNPLLPETKAEAAVPIILGDQVLGVLDVQQNIIMGLSQADVDLLEAIAGQVAVGLRNANLYEKAQNQASREAMLNEINQKILKTTDVDEAMQVAVREIGRALKASQTIVRFNQDEPEPVRAAPVAQANGTHRQRS